MNKNSFHLVLLPQEPLLGIGLINSLVGQENGKTNRLHGLELGLFFIRFTFLRIGKEIS